MTTISADLVPVLTITTTLTGTHGRAHVLSAREGAAVRVEGPSASVSREVQIRVRSALTCVDHYTGGTVVLPPGADAASDLAVAFALAPDLAHGFDAAVGELALNGDVRAVRGIIPRLEALRDAGVRRVLVPASCHEAGLVSGIEAYAVRWLGDRPTRMPAWQWKDADYPSLAEVRGLEAEKAALRAALAAGRDVLFVREPGAGATMLARRATGLLPPITDTERLDCARIASAAGLPITHGRPFRAPHHTVSATGLVGGGTPVRPGEVTLAHHGVLFLDELGEFSRAAIRDLDAALREGTWRGMPARPRVIAACSERDLPRLGPFAERFVRIALPRRTLSPTSV